VIEPKGCDLDLRLAVLDQHHAELFSDPDCLGEDGADFVGGGAGGHVEVIGLDSQQPVAHAAAGQVGLMAGGAQFGDDFERQLAG
jgi:hypothetical protein